MPLPFFNPDDPLGLKALGYGASTATAPAPRPLVNTVPSTAPTAAAAPMMPVTGISAAEQDLQRRKQALLSLSNPTNPLRLADTASSRNLLSYSDPNNPLYAASTQAKHALINTLGMQNQQQRGYYNTAGQFIAQQQNENQRLVNATHDTADLTAVAQAQGQRDAMNRLRASVGIAAPIEINTPEGSTAALPVGVAGKLRTNAEYITDANKEAQQQRDLTLQALRNSLDLTGTNVTDVRLAGENADLNLDQGKAGAAYASKLSGLTLQNAIDEANYNQNLSGLTLDESKYVPFGQVRWVNPDDPSDVRIVTPAQKDDLEYQDQQNRTLSRLPAEYNVNQQRQQYSQQQQGGGSPLAALSEAQVLNQISSFEPGSFDTVRAELIRRYLQHGYNQAQAEKAADDAIASEMGSRLQRTTPTNTPPQVLVPLPAGR